MGPYVHSKNNTSKMMRNLFISLIPIILFSFYKNGIIPYMHNKISLLEIFYPLLFIFVGIISSFIYELLYTRIFMKKRGLELKEITKTSFSIFPGLFVALVLPLNTPISILLFGTFMATIFGKMIYGGFGHNIFNPALIGCLFVLTTYSNVIVNSGGYFNAYELDTISSATPLSIVSNNISYDTLVKPFGSLWNFFFGFIPGSVGEVSFFLCLIAFIYLTITKTIKWKIPVSYIITIFIITFIVGLNNNLGIWYPLFQIMSGGLAFGAVFMATDPVTSPTTSLGQILYGISLGILTLICRYLTPYPEGVLTSILTLNMFVFILDKIGIRNKKYIKKMIISLIIMLFIAISLIISFNTKLSSTDIDRDFNIISKEIENNTITYIATQKGFKGNIKAKVIIKDNEIITYEVLECMDDYLNVVLKEDYLEKLRENSEIDTISGATRTSTALKKLIINIKKDSENNERKN